VCGGIVTEELQREAVMAYEEKPTAQRVGKEPPLEEDEIVVVVPRGLADKVQVAELETEEPGAQITVRVSRKLRTRAVPAVGVIVK
jgi:electron transfer flavoprotein alpha subunit